MNKIVKKKLICSLVCIIIGIIFFIYPIINGKNINEDLHTYMSGFAGGIIGVGIYTFIIAIKAMISPSKGKELENEFKDERLNKINSCAMAISFRISLICEAAVSVICAFTNNMQISQYVGFAICFQLILYIVVHYIVKRNN